MKGFCARCKEIRDDEGGNAWGLRWTEHGAVCKKCGGYIDLSE